ncbi:hypothetical protein C0991_006564 [Blastosporella zonata]|nr:hypothetical protein C0991_006564 [Blastosporella zonata]
MDLALPPGIPTLQSVTGRWTRPDNIWISRKVNLPAPRTASPLTKDFQKADWDAFNTTLKTKLDACSPAHHISTKKEFDSKVTLLTAIIQETIANETIVPTSAPCPFTKHWWNDNLTALKKRLRKANRKAYWYRDLWDHPLHKALK